jgi:hypothetical protein
MAKYKPYDDSQQVMMPIPLEEQLVEDRLDMALFEDRYQNDETGRLAYDSKILLKVVLLGYARGLISSRKMEQACRVLMGDPLSRFCPRCQRADYRDKAREWDRTNRKSLEQCLNP